jgi:phi LC3 family holin
MNVNWTVRAKNPAFWVQIILALGTPVLAYFGITGADITSWPILGQTILDALANPYVCVLALASLYNAIQDPTTPGISDSARALSYTTPGGDD